MLSPVIRVLVIGLVLLAAVSIMTVGLFKTEPPQPEFATLLPEGRPVPEFSLTAHTGGPFTPGELRGQYSLVFFGFSNCPDVCPLTLRILADARAALEEGSLAAPELVFVSVDPERDDREQVARYVGFFGATMTGVFGPAPQLQPLLDFFGVGVHKMSVDGEDYTVTHSGAVFMINPAGEYVAVFNSPKNADQVVRDFLVIRRRLAAS
jgi:protein SCO1/2